MIPIPSLALSFTLNVELGAPLDLGQGRAGQRRIIPIAGGTATGALAGKVLNLGADWQTVFAEPNLSTMLAESGLGLRKVERLAENLVYSIQGKNCSPKPFFMIEVVHDDVVVRSFDERKSLARRPFVERRRQLAAVLGDTEHRVVGRGLLGEGTTLARAAASMGLPAISARRVDARWKSGPAGDGWLRLAVTEPATARTPPLMVLLEKLPLEG